MYEDFYRELGKKVTKLRLKKKISSERLAYSVYLSKQSVINVEKGKKGCRLETILKISEALNVHVTELLDIKVKKE